MSRAILVVDDNEDVREALAAYLRMLGWSVVTAGNGREALERLGELVGQIRLILLDMSMPVMDGPTFRRLQLQDERLSHVPVCLVSGERDLGERARTMGALDFVTKPFDFKKLGRIIDEAMAERT